MLLYDNEVIMFYHNLPASPDCKHAGLRTDAANVSTCKTPQLHIVTPVNVITGYEVLGSVAS